MNTLSSTNTKRQNGKHESAKICTGAERIIVDMDAVIIRLIDLPAGTNGVTVKDENGDFNVYINARLSADARARAWRHEVGHIRRGDFYKTETPIEILEQ